jgi:hypothetical protein
MAENQTKTCQVCKQPFVIEPDDFTFYEKIKVPPPTFCPECRLQRRLAFRNDRTLYKRKCMLCGKDIITIYHPDKKLVVYCQECWWSDKWNPLALEMKYDSSKPFFAQFAELMSRVPLMANFVVNDKTMANSPFNNMVSYLKNCYLLTNSDYNENCAYGCEVENSKDCFDTNLIDKCELCFECVNCQNCYQAFYALDCEGCHDIWFSRNLMNCSNCLGCVNLRGQQYCIFNKSYTKEEYEKELLNLNLLSYSSLQKLRELFEKQTLSFPQKYAHGFHNSNVSGEYIYNSKNTRDSWLVTGCENVRYGQYLVAKGTKDSYDYTQFGDGAELLYEDLQTGDHDMKVNFSWFVHRSADVEYSIECMAAQNLFGCIGVRNEKFCILNKKYPEDEYFDLVSKIKESMNIQPFPGNCGRTYAYGEFFPVEISPFGYNETTAQQYFPLTKEQAVEKGYNWQEPEARNYAITISSDNVPDLIDGIKEDVLSGIIECAHKGQCREQCAKAFRIIPQEYQFYKRFGLPLPHLCPNCRHYQRLLFRNPPHVWDGKCACSGAQSKDGAYRNTAAHFHGTGECPNKFQTPYNPDRKEIIYCGDCYNAEVV